MNIIEHYQKEVSIRYNKPEIVGNLDNVKHLEDRKKYETGFILDLLEGYVVKHLDVETAEGRYSITNFTPTKLTVTDGNRLKITGTKSGIVFYKNGSESGEDLGRDTLLVSFYINNTTGHTLASDLDTLAETEL